MRLNATKCNLSSLVKIYWIFNWTVVMKQEAEVSPFGTYVDNMFVIIIKTELLQTRKIPFSNRASLVSLKFTKILLWKTSLKTTCCPPLTTLTNYITAVPQGVQYLHKEPHQHATTTDYSAIKHITEPKDRGNDPAQTFSLAHRQDIWDGFEELHQLGEAVVAELALTAKMMMVGGDELIKGHSAVRLVAEKIHHLLSKLLGALNFLRCTICCGINIYIKFRKNFKIMSAH